MFIVKRTVDGYLHKLKSDLQKDGLLELFNYFLDEAEREERENIHRLKSDLQKDGLLDVFHYFMDEDLESVLKEQHTEQSLKQIERLLVNAKVKVQRLRLNLKKRN